MSLDWYPGQKVVCVVDDAKLEKDRCFCLKNFGIHLSVPVKGAIYTVREARPGEMFRPPSCIFLLLRELTNLVRLNGSVREVGFGVECFRPIVDDRAIEVFRQLDRDVFGKQRAREDA